MDSTNIDKSNGMEGIFMKRIIVVLLTVLLIMMSCTFAFGYDSAEFSGGNGTEEEPYLISSPEMLEMMLDYPGSYFRLENDIDLSGCFDEDGMFYNDGNLWCPIGSEENPFSGHLDGDGHSIIGLKVYFTTDVSATAGLFGAVENGTIRNLGIKGCNIILEADENISEWAELYAGSIAGIIDNTTIENCFSTGSVTTVSTGSLSAAGALVGSVRGDSFIKTSFNTGKVNAKSIDNLSLAGGICAEVISGKIENCYNAGSVVSSARDESFAYAGGITGEISELAGKETYVATSYNAGNISTVTSSSEKTEDMGKGNAVASGIASFALHACVNNCYTLDVVNDCVGGMQNSGENSESMESGIVTAGVLTDEQMKSRDSFSGFDFDLVWTFDEQTTNYSYPTLKALQHQSIAVTEIEIMTDPEISCTANGGITVSGGVITVTYEDSSTEEIELKAEYIRDTYDIMSREPQEFHISYAGLELYIETVIAHNIDENAPIIHEPTCNEEGYHEYQCNDCGTLFEGETIPFLEHEFKYIVNLEDVCYDKFCVLCEQIIELATEEETIAEIDRVLEEMYLKEISYADKPAFMDIRKLYIMSEYSQTDINNYDMLEILSARFALYSLGDIDLDGIVRARDLSMMLYYYGTTGDCPADLDGDKCVNNDDLSILLYNYGARLE